MLSGLIVVIFVEPAHEFLVHEFGADDLDGHLAIERLIDAAVDDTHPAAADLLDDAIFSDRLADHRRCEE